MPSLRADEFEAPPGWEVVANENVPAHIADAITVMTMPEKEIAAALDDLSSDQAKGRNVRRFVYQLHRRLMEAYTLVKRARSAADSDSANLAVIDRLLGDAQTRLMRAAQTLTFSERIGGA